MNSVMEYIMNNILNQNRYLLFILTLLSVYILSKLIIFIAKHIFMRIAKKTKTKVDDEIIDKTHKLFVSMFVLFGLKFSFTILNLSEKVSNIMDNIFDSLIIIYITIIVIRIVDILINEWGRNWAKKTRSSIDDELLPIFHKTSKAVFVILAIFFILSVWDIDVTGLLAGVGIAGLAISFAVKDSLANVFGGISLILDKTFRVGDIINTDSGDSGRILNIGLRSTRIKNWDGEVVIIPNSIMANSRLVNMMQPNPKVRINIEFGVEYGSDPEKVAQIAKKTIKSIKEVSKEPEINVWFMNMGDSSLNFKAMFWVEDIADKWTIHQKAIKKLYKELGRNKIGIPFPTRTVYLKK